MSDIIIIEAAPDVIVTVGNDAVTVEVLAVPAVNDVIIELYGVIQVTAGGIDAQTLAEITANTAARHTSGSDDETVATMGALIAGSGAATPDDIDKVGFWDSVSGLLVHATFANFKAAILSGLAAVGVTAQTTGGLPAGTVASQIALLEARGKYEIPFWYDGALAVGESPSVRIVKRAGTPISINGVVGTPGISGEDAVLESIIWIWDLTQGLPVAAFGFALGGVQSLNNIYPIVLADGDILSFSCTQVTMTPPHDISATLLIRE